MSQSKHSLKGDIITIRRGVAIYQTHASPFWMARVLDPNTKKYVVRSTKETARLKAREVAEELAVDLADGKKVVPKEFGFTYYALRFIEKGNRLVTTGERNANYIKTAAYFINQDKFGLLKHFGAMDVRELKTRHWSEFLDQLSKNRPDLSPSTRNMLSATFRNVLKVAREDGVIDDVPDRVTAARSTARQFNHLLQVAGIKHDAFTKQDHTVYSLRHTAICMRIILSEGQVNIFNLAKNAGTSVEQIERFYARNLPLSAEMARNLQSFGGER